MTTTLDMVGNERLDILVYRYPALQWFCHLRY